MSLVFSRHPNLIFVSGASALALTISAKPSFIPEVLFLSNLLLYSRILFHREHALWRSVALGGSIALAASLARLLPSLHALSTPTTSLAVLSAFSSISSFIAVITVYADNLLCKKLQTQWSQITLFPAIWATTWWLVSNYLSPVGRLVAWSPVFGMEQYSWIIPYTGPAGVDWLVAAWAVVCSQTLGAWFVGSESAILDDVEPLIPHEIPEYANGSHHHQYSSSHRRSVLVLGTLLTALTLPSFVMNDLALPPTSASTTPLAVGCALPPFSSKHDKPTLDDYIKESKTMTSANIILWPEGAVRFNSHDEREAAFVRVRKEVPGKYVGVSFEESVIPEGEARVFRYTGLALVSKAPTPLFTYYKRHLVPIAESFSLTHSTSPPTIFTIDLDAPKHTKKPDWAPGPNFTRPISVTSSVCLDFAWPSAFEDLEARPALILAPARTWHTSVGEAMWEQAKSRAAETGSMVLWCDGGVGGVSGVAGMGIKEVTQVGQGSWVRTIGVEWPFDQRQTFYARGGNFVLLVFWALVTGGWVGQFAFLGIRRVHPQGGATLEWITHGARSVRNTVVEWRKRRAITQQGEPEGQESEPLLN